MNYDVDHFISKFETIPSSKWCKNSFGKGARRCALGHCGYTLVGPTDEGDALSSLFARHDLCVDMINDQPYGKFRDRSIKQRIMSALDYIKDQEKNAAQI